MYKLRMFNMKWQLLNYFLISSLLTVSSIYIVLEYYKDELVSWEFRMWFVIAILCGLSNGGLCSNQKVAAQSR